MTTFLLAGYVIFTLFLFQIAHFKIPKIIRFVEGFPLTVTGKVQKFKMRQEMEKLLSEEEKITA